MGELDEKEKHAMAVADPAVMTLGLLALDLLHLGRVEDARTRMSEAHARARELRAPAPRLAALWLEALFELRLGNAPRVAAIGDELEALDQEFCLVHARAASLWFRGWAQVHSGAPRAGHELIREGYALAVKIGMRARASETLGYGVEALVLAGDWTAARQAVDEAMSCADAIGERGYLPQLFLLDARIADALGEDTRANESTSQALAEARAQETPWLETLALSAIAEREAASAGNRAID